MTKTKKYSMRLLGYSIYMIGVSRVIDVAAYYNPELNNINHLFGTMLIGLLVGLGIMLAYSE